MHNGSLVTSQIIQTAQATEPPVELLKLLLEYVAREQDHDIQNALFRELVEKHVTLTKKLQEQITQIAAQKQQLEQLHVQKNEFLGIAAHDLRNPIAIIQVYADMLLSMHDSTLSEKQEEFLLTIHRMSEFMLKLLDDLLDISAIESGTLKLDRTPGDYVALVQQNVHLNAMLAEKKQIAIRFEHEQDVPALPLDEKKIEQVLNNLFSNAIKYSYPDTTITVRLSCQNEQVLTEVIDQGQGIPEDDIPHIFETFYRASVRATQGEKSTGLGLAIVKKIIEGHGGTIGVESEVGKGSTFYFALPLQDAPLS